MNAVEQLRHLKGQGHTHICHEQLFYLNFQGHVIKLQKYFYDFKIPHTQKHKMNGL